MQIFAAKVRKPCCLQEFATQKLRPLRVYSRNKNHGGRECMKVVIRIFSTVRAHPINTDMDMRCTWWAWLLVSRGTIADTPGAELKQRSRAGC